MCAALCISVLRRANQGKLVSVACMVFILKSTILLNVNVLHIDYITFK